jgi:predicted nucleic acid-binding protein
VSEGWLLDTSVLSMLAPGTPANEIAEWLRARSDRIFLSVVTVAEIEQGIRKLRRLGSSERARRLTAWLDAILEDRGERILVFDTAMGRLAGEISERATALGRHPGFADVAIASTAARCGLTVLTRNARHFAPLGVAFADPVELPR